MTKQQLDSLKNILAEHQQDIASLGLTDCQLLWSLKNSDGKIAAYSVLVLVPEREDSTTKAVCEKHERKIQFQVEQECKHHADGSEYYTYLQDLELDAENLGDKIMEQRMQDMYATLVKERDARTPEAPLRLCSNKEDEQATCQQ